MKNKLYYLISSSGGAQLFFFLANCLMMAWYAPNEIGIYGYYVTIASVFSVVAALRLDFFAFFSTDQKPIRQESVLYCAGTILIGLSFGLALGACVHAWTLQHALYLSLSLWGFSFFYLVSQNVLRRKEYKLFAAARLSQGVLLVLLIALLQKQGALGLILAYSGSQMLVGFVLMSRLKYSPQISIAEVIPAFQCQIKERTYNTISTLIQYLSPALPMLLGYHLFSKEELGFYFLITQILAGASSILRRSFLGLFNAELMQNGRINPLVLRMIQRLFLIGFVFAIVVSLLSLVLTNYDFFSQDSWRFIMKLLPPLLFLYTIDVFIQPIGTLLPAIGHETYFFAIESLRLSSVFLSVVFIWFTAGNLIDFSYLYSATMSMCYLLSGALFLKFTYQASYCEENM